MFLARMKGTTARATTLSPLDSLLILGTTEVLIPDLVCPVCVVAVVLSMIGRYGTVLLARDQLVSKNLDVLVVVTPVHCVCHAFQTVPIALRLAARTLSKFPSLLIIKSGSLLVSNHSSPSGVSFMLPAHEKFNTGLRFSTRVAYG